MTQRKILPSTPIYNNLKDTFTDRELEKIAEDANFFGTVPPRNPETCAIEVKASKLRGKIYYTVFEVGNPEGREFREMRRFCSPNDMEKLRREYAPKKRYSLDKPLRNQGKKKKRTQK